MVPLDPQIISFPDPEYYHPENGIIAYGGDLSPERLWFAYKNGIFPWFSPGEEILWWSPDPRCVLFPSELKISKSMRKILKSDFFQFSENKCFRTVMENCRDITRVDQDGTWISDELIESFEVLHKAGLAKSVEVWKNEELVGGFYGLQIGTVFCGESMFAKLPNASKAGFMYFVDKYEKELQLIDCQTHTDHLSSLGAKMISKTEFLKILREQA